MLFQNLHKFPLHYSPTHVLKPIFINHPVVDDSKNLLTIGGINSILLTIKIRLQVSTLKVSMVFSQLIPVSNHATTNLTGTHIHTHTDLHTCT